MLATLYQDRRTGIWYTSCFRDGKRVCESTGTKNKKLAKLALEK